MAHSWLAVGVGCCLGTLPLFSFLVATSLVFSQHGDWMQRESVIQRGRAKLLSGKKEILPILLEVPECCFYHILLAKAVTGEEKQVLTLNEEKHSRNWEGRNRWGHVRRLATTLC